MATAADKETYRRFNEFIKIVVTDQKYAAKLIKNDPNLLKLATPHVGETALHYLTIENYVDAVLFLVQQGADINAPDPSGNTPLMYAIKLKRGTMIELLLSNGAVVNAQKSQCDETAVSLAARNEDLELVKKLLKLADSPEINQYFGSYEARLYFNDQRDSAMGAYLRGLGLIDPNARFLDE